MTNFVTIKTFTDTPEAYVVKGHLEANGIKCFLNNEKIIGANVILSNAVGGVQLQVAEEDVQKAIKFL